MNSSYQNSHHFEDDKAKGISSNKIVYNFAIQELHFIKFNLHALHRPDIINIMVESVSNCHCDLPR